MLKTIISGVKSSEINNQYIVILSDQLNNKLFPICVDRDEAEAIALALWDKPGKGGLFYTYDLIRIVIQSFSAKINMVIIQQYRSLLGDDAIIGKLLLSTNEKQIEIECSTQVAVTVAAFTKLPVFIQESVKNIFNLGLSDNEVINILDTLEDLDLSSDSEGKLHERFEANRLLSLENIELTSTEVELHVNKICSSAPPVISSPKIIILSDQQCNWQLALWSGAHEGNIIAGIVENTELIGPHYTLCKIIECFSSKVKKAVIHECRGSTIRAQLIWECRDRCFGVECRPSDAISASLITRTPIYARESILTACCSSTEAAKAIIATIEKYASSKKEVDSLIKIVNPPVWNFWVSTDRQDRAAKRLLEISIIDPDSNIRQSAWKALQAYYSKD